MAKILLNIFLFDVIFNKSTNGLHFFPKFKKKSNINNHVINQIFKFQIFVT